MDILFEIHTDIPRQGPGNTESTAKALSFIPKLPENPKILDIGCGCGMQTLTLAKMTKGQVIAVDIHQPFLDELKRRARQEQLSELISTQNASMSLLNFEVDYFDLIWSEGAIYLMGFREGLECWRRFLKPEGALAVTELSWLVNNPPEEPMNFWTNAYPQMKQVEENITIIKESGYNYINSFTLPESAWWDDYYKPLEARLTHLRKKYRENDNVMTVLEEEQREIELYRNYSSYYGYVFYIMQKSTR